MAHQVLVASAVIGFRESLEVALLVTIILIIFKKTNINSLKMLFPPITLAIIGSLLLGLGAYELVREVGEVWYIEFISYSAAALIILWVITWSQKGAKGFLDKIRDTREIKVIWILLFIFVIREAIEVILMVLPLASINAAVTVAGLGLGVIASIVLSIIIYLYGLKISINKLFKLMGITLTLIGSWMIIEGFSKLADVLAIHTLVEEALPLLAVAAYIGLAYSMATRNPRT